MFGLGKVGGLKRREYNSRVKKFLEQEIGVETDHGQNPRFPEILFFAQLLDEGWYGRRSAEDTAVVIGLMYYDGCAKIGGDGAKEASRIEEALNYFWIHGVRDGKINEDRATLFTEIMDAVQLEYLPSIR